MTLAVKRGWLPFSVGREIPRVRQSKKGTDKSVSLTAQISEQPRAIGSIKLVPACPRGGGQARDRIEIDALTDAYCFVVTAWFGAPGVVLPRFLLSPKVLTVPLATMPVVLPVIVLFDRRTVVPATWAEIAVLLHVK